MVKRKRLSNLTRRIVYLKCDGRCAYCGAEIKFEEMQVDHVVPLNGWSEQGEDTSENLFPACRSCNHYKSRSTLEGFRKMLENMPSVLMRDSTTYRNAVRFGLVEPAPKKIVFYFEKMDAEARDVD